MVRNFSTIRFVLKKIKDAAIWLFGLFLTLSFTFKKMTMAGNVNLVSYGHFNFPLDFNFLKNVGFLILLASVKYLSRGSKS